MIFRLVSNDPLGLVLMTVDSADQRQARRELKDWANINGHTIARNEGDTDATAIMQAIQLLS